ncbi:hypothetical protein IWZ03DRAFT_421201 [Phyllosticta citriasiana]|uniref:C3H1-type domain-containing protein n=1 Tax=Phyllosticta citriasiana TaxID=595635 RepID=A0ABR1KV04_9PEZI
MMIGDSLPVSRTSIRPDWFIQRDNGNYVPVLAVDELPAEVHLEGVPRSINQDKAKGMTFLGNWQYTGQTYSLVSKEQKTAQKPTANSTGPPKSIAIQQSDSHMGFRSKEPEDSETVVGYEKPLSLADKIAKATPEAAARHNYIIQPPLPPSGKQPDQTKKEYCTYWIKTGGCDFTQQGCMYKHEMPDLKTLREKIGVTRVPKWYSDKYPDISPRHRSWVKERLRLYDAAAANVQSGRLKVLGGNDADVSSGSEEDQRRAAVTDRAKAPEPHGRLLDPSSDTELNYVYTPVSSSQKIYEAPERVSRKSIPPLCNSSISVREANISSSTANSRRRSVSSSDVRDVAGRSTLKRGAHNLFKDIVEPPPPNSSPVLAPERRVVQGTCAVQQTPECAKKSSPIERQSLTVPATTAKDDSPPTSHLNEKSLKPKPRIIVSKTAKSGCPSPKYTTTQAGLLSSRHAPKATYSETSRTHASQQYLIDLNNDDSDLNSLSGATPAAPGPAKYTAAHRPANNEASHGDFMPLSESDSSSTIDDGSSVSSGGGHSRTPSSAWDSDMPSLEPLKVIEAVKHNIPKSSTKRKTAGSRSKDEKWTTKQKKATSVPATTTAAGPSSVSITRNVVPSPTNGNLRHSGATRGSPRPQKGKKPAATNVAEPQTAAVGAGPLAKKEKQKKEGNVVPTKIRRPQVVVNNAGAARALNERQLQQQQQQQIRVEVKTQKEA